MYIINFLLIPIILVTLIFNRIKCSYIISLLASLGAAVFVYAQESLVNILFTIAIFNLTPWTCLRFQQIFRKHRLFLEEKKAFQEKTQQEMSKERSIIRQSNSQLGTEVFRIAELYKVTKDMSQALEFRDAFDILGKKMMELFRFQRCRMILADEERALNIKQVLELKYDQPQVRKKEPETEDEEILRQSLREQKISYIEEKSTVFSPLMLDNRFLGALVVEGLLINALENFSILAHQSFLEFKRIRLFQKIQEFAITDGLTGLFVRRYFLQRLQEEMGRSTRHNLRLGFLMIDIDHFKQCNDNFGHLTGDAVLKEVAKKIKASVREIDLVARFGGEEFSVLLPDTDKPGARQVAERIRLAIDRHRFSAYDQMHKIEVSIGVAVFPEDATLAQNLIDKSDQALYRAKQEGRNRICSA